MWTKEAQIKGGKVTARKMRARNLALYLDSPNFCKNCEEPIMPREGEILSEARAKVFCCRSCSAIYNNKHRTIARNGRRFKTCGGCGKKTYAKGGLCRKCTSSSHAKFLSMTKGDLKDRRGNYQSWRSSINRHAIKTFRSSGKQYACAICGYDINIEVHHIVPVSNFLDSALISEINSLDNLIALCPNHHWEVEHGRRLDLNQR
jgi:5-methylcytosine-specific restriction endonuclease McrA